MAEAAVDQFSLSPEELEGIDAKDQPEQKHQKPKPAIMATRTHPGALMPGDFEGLYRLAHIIYHSGFCPKQFTSPEQVFVAIQMGNELGFKPMQSVQGITVINGQPSMGGIRLSGWWRPQGSLMILSKTPGAHSPTMITRYRSKSNGAAKSGPRSARSAWPTRRPPAFGKRPGPGPITPSA